MTFIPLSSHTSINAFFFFPSLHSSSFLFFLFVFFLFVLLATTFSIIPACTPSHSLPYLTDMHFYPLVPSQHAGTCIKDVVHLMAWAELLIASTLSSVTLAIYSPATREMNTWVGFAPITQQDSNLGPWTHSLVC